MRRALVLLDHGSRNAEAHAHLESIAARVRERAPQLLVAIAHLELAEPSLEQAVEALARSDADQVSIYPLFLLPGRHLTRDIPEKIRALETHYSELELRLLEPLGAREELVGLILAGLDPPAGP